MNTHVQGVFDRFAAMLSSPRLSERLRQCEAEEREAARRRAFAELREAQKRHTTSKPAARRFRDATTACIKHQIKGK